MAPDWIYSVLHRDCFELFPDAMFADLFIQVGSARGTAGAHSSTSPGGIS